MSPSVSLRSVSPDELSERVLRARAVNPDLSYRVLALLCGVSEVTLHRAVMRRHEPTQTTTMRVLRGLDVLASHGGDIERALSANAEAQRRRRAECAGSTSSVQSVRDREAREAKQRALVPALRALTRIEFVERTGLSPWMRYVVFYGRPSMKSLNTIEAALNVAEASP